MTDGPDFLARWSRRKRRAGAAIAEEPRNSADLKGGEAPAPAGPPTSSPVEGGALPEPREDPAGPAGQPDAAQGIGPAGQPDARDPDAPPDLPAVETLGQGSDFRRFMRDDVPAALRRAALRKAWSTNPAITGHKPLVDYDWDFHAPGFGALRPGDDPAKLLATLFKDSFPSARKAEDEAVAAQGATDPDEVVGLGEAGDSARDVRPEERGPEVASVDAEDTEPAPTRPEVRDEPASPASEAADEAGRGDGGSDGGQEGSRDPRS